MYGDAPGLAADLAVFDVLLRVATAGIQTDRVLLTTIRTQDSTGGIGCAIAEWKVAIEVELVVVVVECKPHSENVRADHRCHPELPARRRPRGAQATRGDLLFPTVKSRSLVATLLAMTVA